MRSTPRSNCSGQRRCCRRGHKYTLMIRFGRVGVLRRLAIPIAVITSVLFPPRGAEAQQRRRFSDTGYESRIDTTFAFDKSGSVNVSVVSGEIIVTGWSRGEIRIRAVSDDDNIRLVDRKSVV